MSAALPFQRSETAMAACGGMIPTGAHCGRGRSTAFAIVLNDTSSLLKQHEHVAVDRQPRASRNDPHLAKGRLCGARDDRGREAMYVAGFARDKIRPELQKSAEVCAPPGIFRIAEKEGVQQTGEDEPTGSEQARESPEQLLVVGDQIQNRKIGRNQVDRSCGVQISGYDAPLFHLVVTVAGQMSPHRFGWLVNKHSVARSCVDLRVEPRPGAKIQNGRVWWKQAKHLALKPPPHLAVARGGKHELVIGYSGMHAAKAAADHGMMQEAPTARSTLRRGGSRTAKQEHRTANLRLARRHG